MSNLFYYMAQRPGEQQWQLQRSADFYQLMSTKNLADMLANHHQQRRPLAKNQPEAYRC